MLAVIKLPTSRLVSHISRFIPLSVSVFTQRLADGEGYERRLYFERL